MGWDAGTVGRRGWKRTDTAGFLRPSHRGLGAGICGMRMSGACADVAVPSASTASAEPWRTTLRVSECETGASCAPPSVIWFVALSIRAGAHRLCWYGYAQDINRQCRCQARNELARVRRLSLPWIAVAVHRPDARPLLSRVTQRAPHSRHRPAESACLVPQLYYRKCTTPGTLRVALRSIYRPGKGILRRVRPPVHDCVPTHRIAHGHRTHIPERIAPQRF